MLWGEAPTHLLAHHHYTVPTTVGNEVIARAGGAKGLREGYYFTSPTLAAMDSLESAFDL